MEAEAPASGSSASSQPQVTPAPGELPNVQRDATLAFSVLQAGGVIIAPTDVGYGMMAASVEGIERAFAAKSRKVGHSLGIIGTYALHEKLHDLPPDKFAVTRILAEEMGATIGVIAKMKESAHELLPSFEKVTKNGTLGLAIGEGPFLRELGRLNDAAGQIMIGSSANLSGQGQKFQVQDIEPEVLAAADLVIDYGIQKWHLYGRAGTLIDLDNERVLRIGANYEVIREKLINWFGWDVPEDPDFNTRQARVGVSIKLVPDT